MARIDSYKTLRTGVALALNKQGRKEASGEHLTYPGSESHEEVSLNRTKSKMVQHEIVNLGQIQARTCD